VALQRFARHNATLNINVYNNNNNNNNLEMPERQRIYSNAFLCNSALQFRAFARHSVCRLAESIAIQLLVLILFVFNPGDLYYLGYKKIIIIIIIN